MSGQIGPEGFAPNVHYQMDVPFVEGLEAEAASRDLGQAEVTAEVPQVSVFNRMLTTISTISAEKLSKRRNQIAAFVSGVGLLGGTGAAVAANLSHEAKSDAPKVTFSEVEVSHDEDHATSTRTGKLGFQIYHNGKLKVHYTNPNGLSSWQANGKGCVEEVIDQPSEIGVPYDNSFIDNNGRKVNVGVWYTKKGERFCIDPTTGKGTKELGINSKGVAYICDNDVTFRPTVHKKPYFARSQVEVSRFANYTYTAQVTAHAEASAKAEAYCQTPNGSWAYAAGHASADAIARERFTFSGRNEAKVKLTARGAAEKEARADIQDIETNKATGSFYEKLTADAYADAKVTCTENGGTVPETPPTTPPTTPGSTTESSTTQTTTPKTTVPGGDGSTTPQQTTTTPPVTTRP